MAYQSRIPLLWGLLLQDHLLLSQRASWEDSSAHSPMT
jgi:hypothetical protein